jgi:mRNA turnover protein 4
MPRSKRVKVVSLTKTQPKGAEFKSKIIADVREGLDKYENVFVFRFENMRTVVFKDVRARFEESKICLGKNKLVQAAIGKTMEDEYKENMRFVSEKLTGDCGILMTDEPKDAVLKYFDGLRVADYAKAGVVPKDSIVIKPGPLTFPVDMLDQFRKLGLVVEVERGVMVLRTAFQVARKGEALTPEQAKVLVHMGKKISVFTVTVVGAWIDGEFEEL